MKKVYCISYPRASIFFHLSGEVVGLIVKWGAEASHGITEGEDTSRAPLMKIPSHYNLEQGARKKFGYNENPASWAAWTIGGYAKI